MPDNRPIIFAGVEFAASAVTATNPYGYLDDNGVSVWRRLDKPECVEGWKERIGRAVVNDFQGILWWEPGGFNKRQPSPYSIESHCVPFDVQPQLQAIAKLAKAAGLWVGSLLRPADLGIREDFGRDGGFVFEELSSDVKRLIEWRINVQRANGTGDAFYLDSFGVNENDAKTAAWLRGVVGPDVPLYAEAWSDRLGPYCGAFAQWTGTGWVAYSGSTLPVLRWLYPDQPVIALDSTYRPFAERVAWGAAEGVAPLFLGHEVPVPGQVARATGAEDPYWRPLLDHLKQKHDARKMVTR